MADRFIQQAIRHPGALTREVRAATGDPQARPQEHLKLVRSWQNERGRDGKLTRRAYRARFYLRTLKPAAAQAARRSHTETGG